MKPWSIYKVGKKQGNALISNDRSPLTIVSHTCHVESAFEIVRLGEIRPGLVFDESKLNDRRILVSWISPNNWGGLGFRYGNIRFNFDFKTLVCGKRAYWVEAITSYHPQAPRILITDRKRGQELRRYDPGQDKGPWLYDEARDSHYFNGEYTLEFMFEGPISLRFLKSMEFVKHSPSACSVSSRSPKSCAYLGKDGDFGGARFLGRCASAGISLKLYADSFISKTTGRPTDMLGFAFHRTLKPFRGRKQHFTGTVTAKESSARVLATAILGAYSYGRVREARELASLFETVDDCEIAIAKAFARVIGLKSWKNLLPDS